MYTNSFISIVFRIVEGMNIKNDDAAAEGHVQETERVLIYPRLGGGEFES